MLIVDLNDQSDGTSPTSGTRRTSGHIFDPVYDLAETPETTSKLDINALVERTPPATSPGNASTASSKDSTTSSSGRRATRADTIDSVPSMTVASSSSPATLPRLSGDLQHPPIPPPPPPPPPPSSMMSQPPTMQTIHYPVQHQSYAQQPGPPPGIPHYPPMHIYPPSYHPHLPLPDPRFAPGINNKRPAGPHPAASPAKKKQSKWTPDEDAAIIELRGNGMKWEDISKQLAGRSAISCRLRFQNYLERRAEWNDEKKDKLARLYERFKKDMWEKIAKEMQCPWRAAEAMHWQLGETEMAARANVPVFHLAAQLQGGQQQQQQHHHLSSSHSSAVSERAQSPSPQPSLLPATGMAYTHTHNHSLPHIASSTPHYYHHQHHHHSQPVSPLRRNNSASASPQRSASPMRRRADSARSMPAASSLSMMRGTFLPSVGEIVGPAAATPRYTLPPVVLGPGRI